MKVWNFLFVFFSFFIFNSNLSSILFNNMAPSRLIWSEGLPDVNYCEDKLEPKRSQSLKFLNYLAVKLELS